MTLQIKCDCGEKPAGTSVWKDIPDKCDVCNKQFLVGNIGRTQASEPFTRGDK